MKRARWAMAALLGFGAATAAQSGVSVSMRAEGGSPNPFADAGEQSPPRRLFPGDDPSFSVSIGPDPPVHEVSAPPMDLLQRVRIELLRAEGLPWMPSLSTEKRLLAMDETAVPDTLDLTVLEPHPPLVLGAVLVTLRDPASLPAGTYALYVVVTDPHLAIAVRGKPGYPATGAAEFTIGPPRDVREALFMHYRRGKNATGSRRWADLLAEADAMLAIEPRSVYGLMFRCEALANLGRMTEAQVALVATLDLMRTHADPYFEDFRSRIRPPGPDVDPATGYASRVLTKYGLHVPPAPGD